MRAWLGSGGGEAGEWASSYGAAMEGQEAAAAAQYYIFSNLSTVPLQGGYHLPAAESGTTCHASVWRARGFHTDTLIRLPVAGG